ncbi:MAG: glutamine--fructose-6-phosphate transaminase (isomerizing) [Lachnospiraceae bacterium]|uniref:Glutamine--fructose-6-phosphate aminotransferase [isomerizing] n=1 Tax=Hominifimenecus microfluidus TaxID=2885348 RepID=A0AAE3E7L5_9FIRM|nr:glutamine--fructose-6-phosphate transaminase (isomerizing) [Hominifimenecus microfluidus]MCC2229982.1 glutamine--fructose-6-phosphate transaminase (isomerizing) [Hominifimenecus microfluidus]
MCGIIGYVGPLQARDVVLDGLTQLEYRGYDSAGMALLTEEGIYLRKKVGQVSSLRSICTEDVDSHCGIGHTRWATHGGVTDANAHPHVVGRVVLLHNGIIENYHAISVQFGFEGLATSETDTEVAAQLINYYYDKTNDPYQAIRNAIRIIDGSYAFCIMFDDRPGTIYAVRNVSPMVATTASQGAFIASDVTALIPYSKDYFVVPEHHILTITADGIRVETMDGEEVQPEILSVNWDVEAAQKGGYPHFMLKEIHEQPEVFRKTIRPRLNNGLPDFSQESIPDDIFRECTHIQVIACGTAMYAGMVGRAIMEKELRIPVTVSIASEFRYDTPLMDQHTLVIVVSQSGETIDTLAALRLAKECGCKVLSIVNVKGSSIARESDYVLYTHAGPEIAVASTKAYMVQLAVLYLITARMALVRKKDSEEAVRAFITSLEKAPDMIEQIMALDETIRKQAEKLAFAHDAFYIGRGMDYAFSLEGALKLKEISYIHAEAYAAGELKHGTIALIEPGVPVIALATQDKIFAKTISNIREVKARDAYVILITKEGADVSDDVYDIHLEIPIEDDRFTVFPCAVILQLLAYYTAYAKGYDMDKPRNLAKSVTVE